MLTATPKGWPSTVFKLFEDDKEIGSIDLKALSSDLFLQGSVYRLYRKGLVKGEYSIESAGRIIAQAKHAGMLSGMIIISSGSHEYELKPGGMLSGKYALFTGGTKVGEFRTKGRNFIADLPAGMPLPVQTFTLWLMLQIWMKMAAAAN